MQIDPSVLKLPRLPPDVVQRKKDEPDPEQLVANVPFEELVFKLADGVSRGQRKLDETTAQTMSLLAETTVEMPSRIDRRVESDGQIRTDPPEYEERSLLELGFEPTRYQFSEATVEVNFDLSISETETDKETTDGEAKPTTKIRAGTYEATEERKYNRTLETNATMNATLEPVPLPVEISPGEAMIAAEQSDETDETQDGETDETQEDETGGGSSTGDQQSDESESETTDDQESETTEDQESETTDGQSGS